MCCSGKVWHKVKQSCQIKNTDLAGRACKFCKLVLHYTAFADHKGLQRKFFRTLCFFHCTQRLTLCRSSCFQRNYFAAARLSCESGAVTSASHLSIQWLRSLEKETIWSDAPDEKNKSAPLLFLRGPAVLSPPDCLRSLILHRLKQSRTKPSDGRKPWNSQTWCEAERRELQRRSESPGRGLPAASICSARRKSCRSECSESWCHVKLAVPCLNMTLLGVPVLPSWVDFLSISISKTHSVFGRGGWKSEVKRGQGLFVFFCFFSLRPSKSISWMSSLSTLIWHRCSCFTIHMTQWDSYQSAPAFSAHYRKAHLVSACQNEAFWQFALMFQLLCQ